MRLDHLKKTFSQSSFAISPIIYEIELEFQLTRRWPNYYDCLRDSVLVQLEHVSEEFRL